MIAEIVQHWEAAKDLLLPRDQYLRAVWHIHGGLIAYFALTILFARRLDSRMPIAVTWLLELLNEAIDLRSHWPIAHAWVWRDTAADIFNTLLWPTLVFLYAATKAELREIDDTGNPPAPGGLESAAPPEKPQDHPTGIIGDT